MKQKSRAHEKGSGGASECCNGAYLFDGGVGGRHEVVRGLLVGFVVSSLSMLGLKLGFVDFDILDLQFCKKSAERRQQASALALTWLALTAPQTTARVEQP